MFDNLRKGKGASVQEKLAVVETFNGLIQQRAEIKLKEDTLTRGLEQAEGRLGEIPGEEQGCHDDHYRSVVKRELDASQPDLAEDHDRQLASLAAERVDLVGKVKAYGHELQTIRRSLGRLQGEHGEIGRAGRAAWESIADQVIATVPGDFPKQFLRAWVALDRVRDGIHPVNVLAKIAEVELTTESKMTTLDELRREFGLSNEYE